MANKITTTPSRLFLKRLTAKNGLVKTIKAISNSIIEVCRLSIGLSLAEIKVKYTQSYLGIIWYGLTPLFTFAVLYLAFHQTFGENIEHYPLYLMVGIIFFQVFQEILSDASHRMFENRQLLKSLRLPSLSLLLSIFIRIFMTHAPHFLLILGVTITSDVPIWHLVWYPLLLGCLVLITWGMAMTVTIIGAITIDVANSLSFAFRLLWLATPIFYSLEGKSVFLQQLNHYNPLHHFLDLSRNILINNDFRLEPALILFGFSLTSLLVGIYTWRAGYQKVLERL